MAGVILIPDLIDDDDETGRFPLEVERNFLDGCEQAGGSVARCQCALDRIEENYTLEEYATLDARIARTGEVPEEYRDLLADCPDPPTGTATPS